jgi:hypothetical protein
MIYDQPQMLDYETPPYHFDGLYYSSLVMGATKPRTLLLLVSRQFSAEYKSRCEGHSGVLISEDLKYFLYGNHACEVGSTRKAAKNASFMHIHIGAWMVPRKPLPAGLDTFEAWLSYWTPRMPKLETILVNLYTYRENVQTPENRGRVFQDFDALKSLDLLTELEVIVMRDAEEWASKHEAAELIAHWKSGSALPIQFLESPVKFEETCCNVSSIDGADISDELPHVYNYYGEDTRMSKLC